MKERLISIDALRGFTMFWIIGGDKLMRSLPRISDNIVFEFLDRQLCHSEGAPVITFYDIIYPLFLFTIGISAFLSVMKRRGKGAGMGNLYKHIFTRAALLFAMGLIYNVAIGSGVTTSFSGVLQFLALAYLFSSLIMINTKVRGTVIWATGILVFYIVMRYIQVPADGDGGSLKMVSFSDFISGIVVSVIGEKFRGVFTLNRIPGITTALFGVLTGYWLVSKNDPVKKVKGLLLAGLCLITTGLVLNIWLPINKLWGSSFVLFTGGISSFLLGVFYFLIDIRHYKKWSFFFVVIGMNSITVYVIIHLINFKNISVLIVGRYIEFFGIAQDLVLVLITTTLHWLLVYWLYRQKVFIRI